MATESFNPKVDAYINKAKPFAQPIMEHLRELVHKGCPNVEETIKWSRPFFEYRGAILGNMSAFKEHCSFGFWGEEIGAMLREAGVVQDGGMGSLGRITTVKDLPTDKAAARIHPPGRRFYRPWRVHQPDRSEKNKVVKAPKAAVNTPTEFTRSAKERQKSRSSFAAFSPSCKREYVEWIADAKRQETREKRIATAIEWIAEGKQRNWKYQNC